MSDNQSNLPQTKPRLGRGLESLIPKSFLSNGRTITNIPITELHVNPYQPRIKFDEEDIISLAQSIANHGLNQPILVRQTNPENGYEIIAGERRFRACQKAGLSMVPAIIKNVSDKESLQLALIENIERRDLNPMEEALGYKRLMDEFHLTHQQIADVFSRSRVAVTNRLRLLNLPKEVQDAVSNGDISEGHGRALLALEDPAKIVDEYEKLRLESVNVRALEARVAAQIKKSSKKAPGQMMLFSELEKKLEKKVQSKVDIKGSKSKGKIVIHYKNAEQFETLCNFLSRFK